MTVIYSGAGNTFALVDNRLGRLCTDVNTIQSMTYDIDGVICLENSSLYDFKMRIFNKDGSEAQMCGNGLRCLIKFLVELGVVRERYRIETLASVEMGPQIARLIGDEVEVEMGVPHTICWGLPLTIDGRTYSLHTLNTGVPHAVLFEEVENIISLGRTIRFHPHFAPQGTNVNFAHYSEGALVVRTYERGVEGETLACGTGATATALAAAHCLNLSSPIEVAVRSGETLTISFQRKEGSFYDVRMRGGAKKICGKRALL